MIIYDHFQPVYDHVRITWSLMFCLAIHDYHLPTSHTIFIFKKCILILCTQYYEQDGWFCCEAVERKERTLQWQLMRHGATPRSLEPSSWPSELPSPLVYPSASFSWGFGSLQSRPMWCSERMVSWAGRVQVHRVSKGPGGTPLSIPICPGLGCRGALGWSLDQARGGRGQGALSGIHIFKCILGCHGIAIPVADFGICIPCRHPTYSIITGQCLILDNKKLCTWHGYCPGPHGFWHHFMCSLLTHELSPFLPLFVIDVFDNYFPMFVSKHLPVMTVNTLSANFIYDLLVPPSKCLSNPRILMVCES